MKFRKKPCRDCPFRRVAGPGWMGANSPERFVAAVLDENPIHCHTSVKYEDPFWQEKFDAGEAGMVCAGSLIFSANILKSPRDPSMRREPDRALVFDSVAGFVDHHRQTRNGRTVRSWDDREDDLGRRLRIRMGLPVLKS